jgi:hypothetical protein
LGLSPKRTLQRNLCKLEEEFKDFKKMYAHELFLKLLGKYKFDENVRSHMLKMVNASNKLKNMNSELSDNLLIIMILVPP